MRFAGNRWRSMQGGFFDEGVRHLRGYLMLSTQAHVPKSVLITSALPGRRKIDARALAGHGQRGTRQTHAVDRRRPAPTGH